MRTMKDSGIEWIGQIPQEWRMERLRYHAEWNPTTELPSLTDEDNVSFIPMDHLKTGYHLQSIVSYSKVKKGYVCFADGDVLMAKVTPCLENGNLAIADNLINGVGYGSTEINVIRCKSINNRFLFYLLQCPLYIEKATYSMYGVAGLKRLDPEFIPNSYFPFPPIEEQERIVSFVDKKCSEIDTLIAAKEKTNALLKERRQSIIYEAVTKGLNPDVPMKDSGIEWIGQIPEHWGVGKLGYFIEAFNGDRSSNYPSGNDIQDSGVPFLTSSNLERDVLDMSNSKYISEEKYKSMSGLKMELDDIIYCLRGSVGKCAINKTETCGTVASSLMGIRCKKMIPDYLLFLLKSSVIETQNALFMNGTCAANLSAENVCGYLVPIPNETEQRTIAEYLQGRCSEMDELISANEATIQKLKEYRQSVIYEAVTGKIEI